MTSPPACPFHPPAEFRARVERTFTAWPEPERSCALSRQSIGHDPWFGWNLSRADRLLREHPVFSCPLLSQP